MNINELCKATGRLRLIHVDAFGNVISDEWNENLVVDLGRAWIAGRMLDDASIPPQVSHMALGSGSTTPTPDDTALVTELGRVPLDSTQNWSELTQFSATFGPGVATGAVVEAGLFNAATGGTMIARVSFPVKNKGDLDTIYGTWEITIN